MIFFFISKKNTSVGSSAFQKNLQRLDQPTLIFFFAFLKKNTTTGSSHFLSPNGQGYYHSSTFGQISNKKFDKNCIITSQNCKKELEKYIFYRFEQF